MSIPTADEPTDDEFAQILSECCAWVGQHEMCILYSGVALTNEQQADARRIGVTYPERVRLLKREKVPSPPGLNAPEDVRGLAAQYGIYIRASCWGERRIVVHELVHTMQYERLGGIEQFLRPYLSECLFHPYYPNGEMEKAARRFVDEICG